MSDSPPLPRPSQDPQFQRALASLRRAPESSMANNNLGVWYLNEGDDAPSAEILFRRAVQLDPESAVARRNLLLVLRRRDLLHRVLDFPTWLSAELARLKRRMGGLGAVLSVLVGHTLLGVYLLWAVTVVPPLKIYEWLTRRAIETAAGFPGAQRSQERATWPWTFAERLALWLTLAALYAGVLYVLFGIYPEIGVVVALPVVLVWLIAWLVGRVRGRHRQARREKVRTVPKAPSGLRQPWSTERQKETPL